MNGKDKIAEFHRSLVLKQAVMGYNKSDVLESYKNLDSLYDEIIKDEKADSEEQIRSLTEKVKQLESQVEELDTQKKQLYEENGSLHNEIDSLKLSDEERQNYHIKAEMFSTAMLSFEREKAEQEKQLLAQRQAIIEQTTAEAQELSIRFKMEYSDKVNSAITQIKELQTQKSSIVEQMRQLELLISQQIKNIDANHPEEE